MCPPLGHPTTEDRWGKIKAGPEIACGRSFFFFFFFCRIMWWKWVTLFGFSFKMANLPPKKIPVAHSACEFMCVHERDVFVYSFSLCVYRNFEVMHTCIQIPPQVFTQIVKQFVSLKLAHMWNLHADWLHTKQCGRASIKVCSQIRRQN